MMASWPRLGAKLVLLVTLCVVLQCGGADEPATNMRDSMNQLWSYLGSSVQSATTPAVARLTALLDHLKRLQASADEKPAEVAAQLAAVLAVQGASDQRTAELAAQLAAQLDAVLAAQGASDQRTAQLAADLEELLAAADQRTAQLAAQLKEVRAAIVPPPPRDCSDLTDDATSGIHIVRPGLGRPVPVYCDLDTDGGGWTVFQRRAGVQPHQDFYLDWHRYKWGFGALHAEFWWGLEHLWLMTSPLDRRYELRVDMEDFVGGRRHALYQVFTISPEADNYRLTVTSYSGDAGDSLRQHSGHSFSTKDRDNDTHIKSCAVLFGAAWWYANCHSSNLNGLYLAGNHTSYANGVNWKTWKGYHYSLKRVEMKIRPASKT